MLDKNWYLLDYGKIRRNLDHRKKKNWKMLMEERDQWLCQEHRKDGQSIKQGIKTYHYSPFLKVKAVTVREQCRGAMISVGTPRVQWKNGVLDETEDRRDRESTATLFFWMG